MVARICPVPPFFSSLRRFLRAALAISSLVIPETFDASIIDVSCSMDRSSSIVCVFWGAAVGINLFFVSVIVVTVTAVIIFCS